MSSSDSASSTTVDRNRKRKKKQSPPKAKRLRLDDGTSPSRVQKNLQKLRLAMRGELEPKLLPSQTYAYPSLKENLGEEIRILVLEPGKGDDPIKCRLVPSALSKSSSETKRYPFTALSYFWGEGDPICEITVTSYKTPKRRLKKLSDEEGKEQAILSLWKKNKPWKETGILPVRANLLRALQRFRKEDKPVIMWIDAICIDQKDDDERSKQVEKMHELYTHAEKASIWLGDGSSKDAPNPKACFDFLRRILDLKHLDGLLGNLASNKDDLVADAANIVSLMCNKWFSRRWVLQELALAKQAEVVYGEEEMPWPDFADAIAIFIKCQERIRPVLAEMFEKTALRTSEISPAEVVKNLGANALVDFANNLFRRGENGNIQQRVLTLEVLVSNLLAFEATDPRDTIYAVLSLAKDIHRLLADSTEKGTGYLGLDSRISPDYKHKSLLVVYTDFIAYCIDESNSLDILLRHWAPPVLVKKDRPRGVHAIFKRKKEGLPSWIPLIHKSSHGAPSQRVRGRCNGDSFVGTSFRTSHRNYSATLDLAPTIEFGPWTDSTIPISQQKKEARRKKRSKKKKGEDMNQEESQGKSQGKSQGTSQETSQETSQKKDKEKQDMKYNGNIRVKGLQIGTIEAVSGRAPKGMIKREVFEMAGFDSESWEVEDANYKRWSEDTADIPESFWRTLVADRGPNGTNPPSWYRRACMECLDNRLVNGDLLPDAVIDLPNGSSIAKAFLERVKDIVWERQFVSIMLDEEEERTTYGLVPAEAKEDDIICVFFGCSVPVVLSERGSGDEKYFEMVGECFVYGLMDGEAVAEMNYEAPYNGIDWIELR